MKLALERVEPGEPVPAVRVAENPVEASLRPSGMRARAQAREWREPEVEPRASFAAVEVRDAGEERIHASGGHARAMPHEIDRPFIRAVSLEETDKRHRPAAPVVQDAEAVAIEVARVEPARAEAAFGHTA